MRYIKSFENDAAIQGAVDSNLLGHPYIALNESAGTIDWDSKELSPEYQYFTIEALESGNITLKVGQGRGIYYRVDGGEWQSWYDSTGTHTHNIPVVNRNKVQFKVYNENLPIYTPFQTGNTLVCNVYGNIMSLKYNDFVGKTDSISLESMFASWSGLRDASKLVLPSTTLETNCYKSMFYNCSSLLAAPALPATSLKNACYMYMFNGCTSLTSAPELPATTLVGGINAGCYMGMFYNCSSLNYVKALFTTKPGSNYTNNWLSGVSATGTFVKNPNATWSVSGASGIPSGWTVQDAQ